MVCGTGAYQQSFPNTVLVGKPTAHGPGLFTGSYVVHNGVLQRQFLGERLEYLEAAKSRCDRIKILRAQMLGHSAMTCHDRLLHRGRANIYLVELHAARRESSTTCLRRGWELKPVNPTRKHVPKRVVNAKTRRFRTSPPSSGSGIRAPM